MKKLQVKMVMVAFLSSVMVFSILALGMYFALVLYNESQADAMTSLISFGGGSIPNGQGFSKAEFEIQTRYRIRLDEETAFRKRYFVVYLDEEGNVEDIQTDHMASVGEETASTFAMQALLRRNKTGYYQAYRYRVAEDSSTGNQFVIFLDCRDSINAQNAMLIRIVVIAMLFALILTLVFAVFSRKILEPFDRNQRMQKQFITDASHELKTPLAVISANADVLRYKGGNNEWINNITSQTQRMSRLINQLLVLARMEEVGDKVEKESVDMSQIVESSVSKLSEIFSQKGVELEKVIESNVMIMANRSQMENLCDILIENASKYVDEKGRAGVRLSGGSGKKMVLTVFNTAEHTGEMDCERIFERFYRADASRTSSTGGHGIGLSIAKRIAEQHKGSITAKAENGQVSFTVRI